MSTPESNGRPPATSDARGAAGAHVDLDDFDADELVDAGATAWPLDIAFTPRKILGGFALLAALIVLLRRRRRSR